MLVLEKGLAVISCFDGHRALSISEVAARTGLSRAAARRCLLTLVTLRYAVVEDGVFRLAPRVLTLGFAYLASADLPQIVQPALDRLGARLGEACSAAVLNDTDVLYVARAAAKRIISVDLKVGSRLPAYCNAMGRVLLAGLPAAEAEALLRRSERIPRTPATLTDLDDLMAELERVREQDHSVVRGELEAGLLTIAVPIRDVTGRTVAGVNVGTHVDRATPESLRAEALPLLRALQDEMRPLLRL